MRYEMIEFRIRTTVAKERIRTSVILKEFCDNEKEVIHYLESKVTHLVTLLNETFIYIYSLLVKSDSHTADFQSNRNLKCFAFSIVMIEMKVKLRVEFDDSSTVLMQNSQTIYFQKQFC